MELLQKIARRESRSFTTLALVAKVSQNGTGHHSPTFGFHFATSRAAKRGGWGGNCPRARDAVGARGWRWSS